MNIDRLLKQGNEKVTFTRTTQSQALGEWHMLKHAEHLLGVPLIILIMALKKGCYYKDGTPEFGYHVEHTNVYVEYYHYNNELVFVHKIGNTECCLYAKDYGKTWALTKEELEESDEERKNLEEKRKPL